MREMIAVLVILNGLAIAIYLFREKTLEFKSLSVVLIAVLAAGVIIAKLPDISHFAASEKGITLEMRKQVETVTAKAEEVKELKNQVAQLANDVKTAHDEITSSKQQIDSIIQDAKNIKGQIEKAQRETAESSRLAVENSVTTSRLIRSYSEIAFVDFSTRNFVPAPRAVIAEVDRKLNELAVILYPNEADRRAWIAVNQQKLATIMNQLNPPQR